MLREIGKKQYSKEVYSDADMLLNFNVLGAVDLNKSLTYLWGRNSKMCIRDRLQILQFVFVIVLLIHKINYEKKSFITVTPDEGIGNKILSVDCDAYNDADD